MNKEQIWFEAAEWIDNIEIKVHESTDVNQFYKQYHARPDLWKAVFKFLKKDLQSMEIGKYPLVGDEAIATVMAYETKKPEDAKWEAHRKFIDLQYIISGEEKMGLLPLEKTVDPLEYNETKDLIFFGDNEGAFYVANPDVFFLFFPTDVHRPGIEINGSKPLKKLVIKIAVAD